MSSNFCQIAIAGNIGAGKTTLTKKLSEDLNIKPIFESVDDNHLDKINRRVDFELVDQ